MSEKKPFFSEHFPAIITGIVSIAAVLVSLIQLKVTSLDKEKELILNKQNSLEVRRLEEIKANRIWMLDIANYFTNHRKEIFSKGEEKAQIEKIILATFPAEISSKVFENLYDISENKDDWAKAKAAAFSLENPSTKIFYEKDFPNELIDSIGDTLAEGDISYPFADHVIPVGLTNGDVRYFSEKDKAVRRQLQSPV